VTVNAATLPPLRQDLGLLPGPALADGQPSWTLHDPARNLFFRIDWASFEILQRWALQDPQAIAADVAAHTTLQLEPQDVADVGRFLAQNQLVQIDQPASARQMAERAQAGGNAWTWLLHHYLFFRVPLVRPDAWLGRWQGVAARLASPGFLALTLAALLLGVTLVVRHWEVFAASLVDTFNLEGLAAYGVALLTVKVLHELGHAFTAKRLGCRVPTMGVAFLVMWPVAYTDTNDTWRLTNRLDRLRVACAGIATELVIAAWATLAWGLLPDGALRSAAFVLATTSWVATLAINASPFMRFDGYFILSDALDMPNLHERSFAMARWHLRERLFGLGDAPPEAVSPRAQRWMIAFAWATWLYRLVLFIGIALLVYHLFFKALGVLLFVVELAWFIVKPIRSEWQVWMKRRGDILRGRRVRWSSLLLGGLVLALLLPWPTRVTSTAWLRPAEAWPIHAANPAQLQAMPWRHGDAVPAGAVLAQLHSPELQLREQALLARLERLRWQAASAGFDAEARQQWQGLQESLATAEAEQAGLQAEQQRLQPTAPWAGRLLVLDPDLHEGQWLARQETLGVLVRDDDPWLVETWLDEAAVARIEPQHRARFVAATGSGPSLGLTVTAIDRDATRALPRPELAAPHGGHVMVREQDGQLRPEQAVYRVQLAIDPADARQLATPGQHAWRGHLGIDAHHESPATRYLRQALAVLVRETGF
jgi:putative peptide zinc metalloprotease protein